MLIHWIWLATRPDMSDRQKKLVLDAFGDPEDVFCAEEEALLQIEGIHREAIASLMDKNLTQAQKILRQCVDKEISVCTYHDKAYPNRLKHIVDPPLVLYHKGQIPNMDAAPVIAAVGTRKASAYGMNVARRMGYQISGCGGILVSGVAEGNDGMAMQGALLAGGRVVGVLGCGADVVYPKCNRRLFEDMERCGCLISEFPPETLPYKWNFPRRNRIMSGLSNGVVVIEAPERSGSLITARQALEQGRDVFCVPGNVDMPTFEGSNALLREGAIPVRNGWDVVSEYEAMYPGVVHLMDAEHLSAAVSDDDKILPKVAEMPHSPAKKRPSDKKKEKKPIDNSDKPSYSDVKDMLPKLPENERQIVELLTSERLVDDLITETGLHPAKVGAALTMLEIKGIIKRLPGKRITLK